MEVCPKCGAIDIKVVYHGANYSGGCEYGCPGNTLGKEHLVHRCERCGYRKAGPCKDADSQPPVRP